MSHQRWNYTALMREHGYRVTPQRQLILDAICAGGGHTTAEEIYERVHAKAPAISLPTVYRTLDFLCGLRLVVAADLGGGHRVYEIAGDTPHHHLVCRACGSILEIDLATVEAFFAHIQHEQEFLVETDHLALFGLCAECLGAHEQANQALSTG